MDIKALAADALERASWQYEGNLKMAAAAVAKAVGVSRGNVQFLAARIVAAAEAMDAATAAPAAVEKSAEEVAVDALMASPMFCGTREQALVNVRKRAAADAQFAALARIVADEAIAAWRRGDSAAQWALHGVLYAMGKEDGKLRKAAELLLAADVDFAAAESAEKAAADKAAADKDAAENARLGVGLAPLAQMRQIETLANWQADIRAMAAWREARIMAIPSMTRPVTEYREVTECCDSDSNWGRSSYVTKKMVTEDVTDRRLLACNSADDVEALIKEVE